MNDEYGGEILEVEGVKVNVVYTYDTDTEAPWDNCDGHGPVSEWTTRDKRPGERVLCQDRNFKQYYDWQAACKLARKEWGSKDIEAAVQADFDYLRAWCNDNWQYVGVRVAVSNVEDSIWGVETYKDYHMEYAKDMARELVGSMRHEEKEVAYWASRDVLTVEG